MKLNLFAPLNTVSYGYVSSYILREFLKNNDEIGYFPIGNVSLDQIFGSTEFVECLKSGKFYPKAPCLKIWHQFDLAHFVGSGPNIAMPIFELDEFTEKEKLHLSGPDLLFVNSKWAKSIVDSQVERDPDTTIVIPLGVDSEIFKPGMMLEGKTVFANYGKWEVRKGHDVLHEAFNAAFEDKDDVELYMMPHNHMLSEQTQKDWAKYYTQSKLGSKISILPPCSSHKDVYNAMKYVHCGVFPTRAEGWNMEALELLACGKHLIITNYSGQTEYCTPENSFLIDIKEKERAYDGVVFNGQGSWGAINNNTFDQLVESLRNVHKLNMEGNLGENQKGIETAKQFSWDNTYERIRNVISSF